MKKLTGLLCLILIITSNACTTPVPASNQIDTLPAQIVSTQQSPTPTQHLTPTSKEHQCVGKPRADFPKVTTPGDTYGWNIYTNEEYHFSFAFPANWQFYQESDHFLCLKSQPVEAVLRIGYKWLKEDLNIFRSKQLQGEIATEGLVKVLGQEIDRRVIRYAGQANTIIYDTAGRVFGADLEMAIELSATSVKSDLAADLIITEDIQHEVDAIVQSFQFIERYCLGEQRTGFDTVSTPGNLYGWNIYNNDEYGFHLAFPPNWLLFERSHSICLRPVSAEAVFYTGFKWSTEDVEIFSSSAPEGEFFEEGTAVFLGEETIRQVLRYEDRVKVVMYDTARKTYGDKLEFSLDLRTTAFDKESYLRMELTEEIQAVVDSIVESLRLVK